MSSQRERQRERSQSAQSGNTENVRQHTHTQQSYRHSQQKQLLAINLWEAEQLCADMLSHTHTKCFTMLFKTYFGGSFRNTGFRINNPIICMRVMCVCVGRVKPTEESERDIDI